MDDFKELALALVMGLGLIFVVLVAGGLVFNSAFAVLDYFLG